MVLPIYNPTKSFWIEAAESPLRNFRSTSELPEEADVVIIGSGYTGATCAYWLDKFAKGTQPKMVMLEARGLCEGATGRNGGQLRPHLYSRYTPWSKRFGPKVAMDLITHENAHLAAFNRLFTEEDISEEVCFKLGETFDACMSDEAEERLLSNLEEMKRDHGEENEIVKGCRVIMDQKEAEEFTQMKGCQSAVVHPAGQVWPYKFVHALLRIVHAKGNLNIQDQTPATSISEKDADGYITVATPRGTIRAKAVMHATNRWASHVLPEYKNLILPGRGTLAAIKAPEGFIKHTGAQHWDAVVNNYHLQLPPPYNHIILGGAKPITIHAPTGFVGSDEEDKQFPGVPEYYASWPKSDVVGWEGEKVAEFGKTNDEGGVWSGVYGNSIDSFPFVGAVPRRKGHFLAAGFTGHGMPRILLSTAHLAPSILDSIGVEHSTPSMIADVPPLPAPYVLNAKRLEKLKNESVEAYYQRDIDAAASSAKKDFFPPPIDALSQLSVSA